MYHTSLVFSDFLAILKCFHKINHLIDFKISQTPFNSLDISFLMFNVTLLISILHTYGNRNFRRRALSRCDQKLSFVLPFSGR